LSAELDDYLQRQARLPHGANSTEIAYALACGLEDHRDDLVLGLLGSALCGEAQDSVMKDQKHMIHELEDLVNQCQEDQVEEQTRCVVGDASRQEDRRLTNGRRLVQATLRVFFPSKRRAREKALRQSLDSTIEELGRLLPERVSERLAAKDFLSATDGGHSGVEWMWRKLR